MCTFFALYIHKTGIVFRFKFYHLNDSKVPKLSLSIICKQIDKTHKRRHSKDKKDTDVYTVSPMSNQECAQSCDFI